MLPVDFLSGARRDFDESFDWYAERSVQTAVRFAAAVDAALEQIAANPTQCPSLDRHHRECPVKKFVYRLVDDRLLIIAIAHAKRRPGYWHDRT